MIKGSTHQENMNILPAYAFSKEFSNTWSKTEKFTFRVGYFNAALLIIEETSRQNIEDLNNTVNQLDLIVNYRTFHPTAAKYIYSSQVHLKYLQ